MSAYSLKVKQYYYEEGHFSTMQKDRHIEKDLSNKELIRYTMTEREITGDQQRQGKQRRKCVQSDVFGLV